jgi:rhodanese-related sulfurtransferase
VTDPHAVLTGDTLFVGDVGRPDLRVALGWSAKELGGMLYESVHGKLLTLPDRCLVYPAHGAGSLCGKALGNETFSTIGEQRRFNYALQPMTKAAFIDLVTADQPDAPPYFTYDAVLNTQERPTLDETLARTLTSLSLGEVLAHAAAEAQVLDARDPTDFAAAHLTGSINVGLDGAFATWAGTVLSRERPIVIVADPGREHEAAVRLGRIGFDRILGFLEQGLLSLRTRPDLLTTIERISPGVAMDRLAHQAAQMVDVRAPHERQHKRIDGTISLPLSQLPARLDELDRDRRLIVHCAGGYRSSIAASLLEAHGFTRVSELAGGVTAWEAAGLPTLEA